MSWCLNVCAVGGLSVFSYFELSLGGRVAVHSAYDMYSLYLIVNLVSSHLGFWSKSLFLIASFPDRCLLVPF